MVMLCSDLFYFHLINFNFKILGILDLMRKLLCKNPSQRIKLTEIHKHPWVIRGPEKLKSTPLNQSAENVLKLCGVNS